MAHSAAVSCTYFFFLVSQWNCFRCEDMALASSPTRSSTLASMADAPSSPPVAAALLAAMAPRLPACTSSAASVARTASPMVDAM